MVEIFDEETFETSLPDNFEKFFSMGEVCYFIPFHGNVGVYVRSSISKNGISAETGEDSIRVYYAEKWATGKFNFLGKKYKWLKRVNGWNTRVSELISYFQEIDKKYNCCGQTKFFVVKKESPNKGRHFATCSVCKAFTFID